MHDAVQLEALGVPAVLIVTEPFVPIAAAFAPTVGADGYTPAVVPHPVSSKDEEALAKYAADVVDQVARRLTA